jgi:hypothetical protein
MGPLAGDDLGSQLSFATELDDQGHPRILRIHDNSGLFQHRKWYRIVNNGTWPGVASFELDYSVVAGDANNDGMTQFSDLSTIYAAIPTFHAAPTDRNDINGDGTVNFADLSMANTYIPTVAPRNPCK